MQMLSSYRNRVPGLLGALSIVVAACLAGCASKNPLIDSSATAAPAADAPTGVQTTKQRRFLGIFSPYRVDIQQGNFVSREMVAQLKEGMKRPEGMTAAQVQFVLGTPLLTDVFHKDRWDYIFQLQRGNGEIIKSQLTVFLKDGRLLRFEGGDLPTEKDYISLIAGNAPKSSTPSSNEVPVATPPAAPEAPPAGK